MAFTTSEHSISEMIDFSSIVTNKYERKARLYPALLLISPLVAVGAAFISSSQLTGFESVLVTVISCGGAFLLTQLARDTGKKKEKRLFALWGGMPSIAIFRHRDEQLDPITKKRYHEQLSILVEGTKAPSVGDEERNPENADEIYAAWSNFLRANTRDSKIFNLLLQENISYGYRRNIWGLRSIGISFTVVAFLGSAARIYVVYRDFSHFDEPLLAAGGFCLLIFALWVFRFNSDWVRIPAIAYAERLAESVDILAEKFPSTSNFKT